ncbi:MAG: GTP-binding protein [Candidatus Latescibacterota bacterium]|nr:MAG: GTP-binding protein [Candidatus Latescibacterota bacterium]RKY71586.1 MAG: GTP-binding protein [Candidatus Latescibacterota bacterium]
MPANLPPEYYAIERRYRLAKSAQEKIAIVRELLAIMPKHKGTERLQAELRGRIAKLSREAQKKRAKRGFSYHIKKEGAAQLVLIGPPNAGKSQILASLTNAVPEVTQYPFATRRPLVGMAPFEDISFQLVDTPSIAPDFMEPWLPDIVRNADLTLLVADLGVENCWEGVNTVIERLAQVKIELLAEMTDDKESDVPGAFVRKKTIMVANKIDLPQAQQRFDALKSACHQRFPLIPISAKRHLGLEEMKRKIHRALGIVRVYTKAPGRPADREEPVILRKGDTVIDAAQTIHKDLARELKYARLWGSNKFDGQRVERDYTLEDGDVVEFHT